MVVDVVIVQHAHKAAGAGDVGLTDEGRRQAESVAALLEQRLPDVRAVWSSPQRRALETTMPIAAALGLPIEVDHRLRERMNRDAGSGLTLDEFLAEWRRATADRAFTPSSGDSSNLAAERFLAALADIAARTGSGTVVVVSHGGVTVDALRTLAGDVEVDDADPTLRDDGVPNGAVTLLRVTDGTTAIVGYPTRWD